jgi:hypothetical protein
MNRVYILGAGASEPYGLPLMRTLTWDLYRTLRSSNRAVVASALRECFGTTPCGPQDAPNFEEFLNLLDKRSLRYLKPDIANASSRPKAAEIVLDALRRFIRDKCASLAKCRGPYDRLVASIDPTTVVISFNWDVLLELALRRAGRAYSYLSSSGSARSHTLLLKPHGSINWFALLQRHGFHIPPRSNIAAIGDLSSYLCYITQPLERPHFGGRGTSLRGSLANVPAIVPPTASKRLSVGGVPGDGFVEEGHTKAMTRIWDTAASALARAHEVVVIGYSMPGADAASTTILKHFASPSPRSRKRKRLFLVEQNNEVAQRYTDVLGVDAQIICDDFNRFDPSKPLPKRSPT